MSIKPTWWTLPPPDAWWAKHFKVSSNDSIEFKNDSPYGLNRKDIAEIHRICQALKCECSVKGSTISFWKINHET